MISERDLLEAWQQAMVCGHFYTLATEVRGEFEYRGPQFGHPSNYAAIKFVATPARNLCLESSAALPKSISESYARLLLGAVGRAAVDELFAAAWYPYRGCKLVMIELGWDEIMSSEVAVYRAARGALSRVRQHGKWELVT